ncbi:MAG: hypothetical protein HKN25_13070 [Pyrinomonadaceae bacterium]|nr:hypothetical protein [Pyrinomonadaceae bacterium]
MKKTILSLTILLIAGFSLTAEAQKRKVVYKIAKAGVGIDGIRVGISTRADVIRKYGRDFTTKKHGRYSAQMRYKNGMSFYYCQKDRKQEIFDIELRSPARVKTAKGLVLSKSTVSEARKKYGKPRTGLQFRGIEFYYNTYRGRKVITVIDIVEKNGMRECRE